MSVLDRGRCLAFFIERFTHRKSRNGCHGDFLGMVSKDQQDAAGLTRVDTKGYKTAKSAQL